MKLADLKKIKKHCKHFADYTETMLITDLGLYDSVLIDTKNIKTYSRLGYNNGGIVLYDEVSPDVKNLHAFLFSEQPLELPCPYCRRNQPFKPIGWINPKDEIDHQVSSEQTTNPVTAQVMEICTDEENDNEKPPVMHHLSYEFGNDRYIGSSERNVFDGEDRRKYLQSKPEAYVQTLARKCMIKLPTIVSEFRKDYRCTMNPEHRCSIGFVLKQAVYEKPDELLEYENKYNRDKTIEITTDEEEVKTLYEELRFCLIAQKTLQFPSMLDMQLFDSQKYQSALRDNYGDYTRALMLISHRIGVGAFIYLRRVFESIIEEIHHECAKEESWDEEAYKELHFNEKIEMLERKGKEVIPSELFPVKNKLYGVLSTGVHKLTEEQCIELFPYLKAAIDIFLDEKKAKKEREQKIKIINKQIQSVNLR